MKHLAARSLWLTVSLLLTVTMVYAGDQKMSLIEEQKMLEEWQWDLDTGARNDLGEYRKAYEDFKKRRWEKDRMLRQRKNADSNKTTTRGQTASDNDKIPNPFAKIGRQTAAQHIKTYLEKKYPGKYSTQKMLFDANMKAFDELSAVKMTPVIADIFYNLKRYWPNYSTIKMLYVKNLQDYKALQQTE